MERSSTASSDQSSSSLALALVFSGLLSPSPAGAACSCLTPASFPLSFTTATRLLDPPAPSRPPAGELHSRRPSTLLSDQTSNKLSPLQSQQHASPFIPAGALFFLLHTRCFCLVATNLNPLLVTPAPVLLHLSSDLTAGPNPPNATLNPIFLYVERLKNESQSVEVQFIVHFIMCNQAESVWPWSSPGSPSMVATEGGLSQRSALSHQTRPILQRRCRRELQVPFQSLRDPLQHHGAWKGRRNGFEVDQVEEQPHGNAALCSSRPGCSVLCPHSSALVPEWP